MGARLEEQGAKGLEGRRTALPCDCVVVQLYRSL